MTATAGTDYLIKPIMTGLRRGPDRLLKVNCSGMSEAKLEPRLGRRFEESGADQEMPFDIPHQIQLALPDLEQANPDMPWRNLALDQPKTRRIGC